LGHERIDLDAGSYGTRLALVYLKRHPDRVRSAVLRGVSPTDYRNPLPFPRAGQFALDRLFAGCAAEPACHAAFPDLPAKFAALLDRLDREPVTVVVPGDDGSTREIRIGRERFVGQLHLLLFLPELAAQIPWLVDRAHAGVLEPFAGLAAAFDAAIEAQIYWGLQLAVVCPEDLARITEADVAREAPGTFLGEGLIRDYQEICRAWPAAPLPADYWEPTRSDVPVLLVSGEIDPSTPPRFGDTVARTLPRSRHVVIPGGTHIHRSPCLDRVVEEFLAAADPEAVDIACLLEAQPPPFFLGE
jgi:pimeloyl-ACP methyl ester carboxylesterase